MKYLQRWKNLAYIFLGISFIFLGDQKAYSSQVVHTYVTHVQTERERTRFTLTEWLRIKERMRMMDLWMALFSNPKQHSTFRPEFYLSYSQLQGVAIAGQSSEGYQVNGTTLDSQLWLTNLVSATTRMRTVNVDFGFGMQMHSSSINGAIELNSTNSNTNTTPQTITNQNPSSANTSATPSLASIRNTSEPYSRKQSASFNLRLFGRHIQDSSLIVGYGIYDAATYVSETTTEETASETGNTSTSIEDKGNKMNASLQIYLSHWLGMEGNYEKYSGKVAAKNQKSDHTYYDYSGFLEVSLLRVSGGIYTETRNYIDQENSTNSVVEAGVKTAVKLQF